MRESTFPKPVGDVVTTLAEIFRHQKRRELVELLESAHAYFDQIEFDNWNGGTYTWALRLEVPVHIFAAAESGLPSMEKEISAKLTYFHREYPNDHLSAVTIAPLSAASVSFGQRMAPSEIEVRRLWADGRFRLFLSHVSAHKVVAAALKEALWLRGIHAFVAHEDVEPSLEWQTEIELALKSMHALAALITPDFHASRWTDQEVGWALGRGVPVLPLRVGDDPYGLIAKYQGIPGRLTLPRKLAAQIADTLVANRQTHGEMRRAVVNAFSEASSTDMAKAICPLLLAIEDITEDEKARIWRASTENAHVRGADGVSVAIYSALGSPAKGPAVSLRDDDIPF